MQRCCYTRQKEEKMRNNRTVIYMNRSTIGKSEKLYVTLRVNTGYDSGFSGFDLSDEVAELNYDRLDKATLKKDTDPMKMYAGCT